jgi:hypothetical protein
MVLFRPDDYERFDEALAWDLLEAISLPEERFLEVAALCFGGDAPDAAAAERVAEPALALA